MRFLPKANQIIYKPFLIVIYRQDQLQSSASPLQDHTIPVRRWNRVPRPALAARYAVSLPDPEMSDAAPPTAEYYRSMAEEIRRLAETSQSPEVRRELFELVERFTRMAEHIERRHPDRAGHS